MSPFILLVTLLIGFIGNVASECANACSGHGKCTSYDMCICNRNWQSNDCSERVCQFGLAHVDTPKGDLNMDGQISKANDRTVENSFNYPYGTTEQFPSMQDSNNGELYNTAHDYMECSNKGECDRSTGECKCFDGYDGVACQRASCPNSCSGHGVCKSARQLAASDYGNIYKLWDKQTSMGCECDAGFGGPDCSDKFCKHGVDPLYLDDISTIKYPVWNFATLSTAATGGGAFHDSQEGTAYWAIRFFDSHGEDWLTNPIVAGATCNQVMKELYNIPNNVIPWNSLRCTKITNSNEQLQSATAWNALNGADGGASDLGTDDGHGLNPNPNPNDDNTVDNIPGDATKSYWVRPNMAIWEAAYANPASNQNSEWGLELFGSGFATTTGALDTPAKLSGYIYRIQFLGNPGNLREPEIEVHLDGKRPTIQAGNADLASSATPGSTFERVITKVWTDGQQGEDEDYFADHCDGVEVTITWSDTTSGKNTGIGTPTAGSIITPTNANEVKLLKRCLGDADFDTTNNVELSDWDVGTVYYPHLIKLVRSITTYTDGGFYAALYYHSDLFKLVNPFYAPDETGTHSNNIVTGTDKYEVYTTTGTLALTSIYAEAMFGFASKFIFTVRATADTLIDGTGDLDEFDGDLSCEVNRVELESATGAISYWRLGRRTVNGVLKTGFAARFPGMWTSILGSTPHYRDTANPYVLTDVQTAGDNTKYYVEHCLNKSDIFTLLNWDPLKNPAKVNLYRAQKIFRNDYAKAYSEVEAAITGTLTTAIAEATDHHSHWMTRVITTDISTNWAASNTEILALDATAAAPVTASDGGFKVYKFFPAAKSTYKYVAPCSNRGICDTTSGLCQCFPGYTSDACSEQSSLAI